MCYSNFVFVWLGSYNFHFKRVIILFHKIFIIVYYKSLSDSNWRENDYNKAYFYSIKILYVGCGGNKILFWITNMTNYLICVKKIGSTKISSRSCAMSTVGTSNGWSKYNNLISCLTLNNNYVIWIEYINLHQFINHRNMNK